MRSTGSKGESSTDSGLTYALLLGNAPWRQWALASRLALLTISMGPLGYVLAGRAATGSFAAGGLLAGANAFGQGLGAPLQGRRLDRNETRTSLLWMMTLAGGVFGLLALAVSLHAPLAVLLGGAFLAGVSVAGVPGGYRALLPGLVAAKDVDMALTVDAALVEVVWITGPPLVSFIVVLSSATVALATMAVLALLAAALSLPLPRRPPHGVSVHVGGVITRVALPIYAVAFAMGLAFGGLDFGFAPLAKAIGAGPAAGGILISLLAASSGVSALVYATRRPAASTLRRVGFGLMIWAVLMTPLSLIPSLWIGILLTPLAGLPVSVLNTQVSLLLRVRLPHERQAEAFSIVWSSMTIGAGIGSTIGSACIGPLGVRSVFLIIPAMVLVLGAVLAAVS